MRRGGRESDRKRSHVRPRVASLAGGPHIPSAAPAAKPTQPRPTLGRVRGLPVEWQRTTMAHLCSVYPFHADTGFGERGVLMGANVATTES